MLSPIIHYKFNQRLETMAQERTFIAVRWIALCKPGDDRYVIKNRETDEVVDDNHGKGYQSPKAAHASFAFKQKYRGWKSSGKIVNK